MSKKITYTKLILQIIILSLSISLIIGYVYSEYLKQNAIKSITKKNAKKTSKLVFQTLYSAMEKGWEKRDIEKITSRLNQVDENLKINIFRSAKVTKEYGDLKANLELMKSDKNIDKSLKTKENIHLVGKSSIKYYYPIIASKECLECHKTANVGEALGTISIEYQITKLKSSITSLVNFFILFLLLLTIFLFISLFTNFRTYIVKPINTFIKHISTISRSKDMSTRIDIKNDIEEIEKIQKEFNKMLDIIEKQIYYDSLTNLPNRKKLIETLEHIENSILMIINIDKFQEINDLYGEDMGDSILQQMAKLLNNSIPPNNILYRLQADEYAILYSTDFVAEDADSFAQHINREIENHIFKITNQELSINATIGISYGTYLLLNNADIALKLAKKRKTKYLVYDSSINMEYEYEQNLKWAKRIKEAISKDKIIPLFQPIVNLETKQVDKYEALIRMIDDDGNFISPIHFLDHSKKNKLYLTLTMIMIEKSFEACEKYNKQISINLSIEDILNKEISEEIIKKLENYTCSENIIFELLETEQIEKYKEVEHFINRVKSLGVKISIDDFGTGYSNFKYLTKLNVDFIKIDSSLIKDIDKNRRVKMTTETIRNFSKKMGIKTIAEFVHSKEVYKAVEKMGIDYAQGYYIGKPKTFT